MQQVNQESRGVVIPPVGIGRKGIQETTLSTLPDKNFSIRTKDDGSWPSLNFKLKNTVGYIPLLENSLRTRARDLFPSRCVLRRETKIRFSNILRPDCSPRALDSRIEYLIDYIITCEVLSCRGAQLRPHYCNCSQVTIALYHKSETLMKSSLQSMNILNLL